VAYSVSHQTAFLVSTGLARHYREVNGPVHVLLHGHGKRARQHDERPSERLIKLLEASLVERRSTHDE
jgi:hypothetical protein